MELRKLFTTKRPAAMSFSGREDANGFPIIDWQPGDRDLLRVGGMPLSLAEVFRSQPAVRICVGFLARQMAHLKLKVYERTDEAPIYLREEDHNLAKLLCDPNPRKTGYDLIHDTVADIAIYDTAYWLKQWVGDPRDLGRELRLFRIPPAFVYPYGGSIITGPEEYRINFGNSGPVTYPPERIVDFSGYNALDTRWGTSPLEALRHVLNEELASSQHREGYWANAARVEGVIERPIEAPKLDTKGLERLQQAWTGRTAGRRNAGKTGILEEGGTFKPASFSPKDSEFIAGREFALDTVATVYNIPLAVLSRKNTATFACLPGETLVSTERGSVPICEVEVGERVWSMVDDGLALRHVEMSGQTGVAPLLTIHTANREIAATGNHPFLVRRRVAPPGYSGVGRPRGEARWTDELTWVRADELVTGDILVVLSQLPDHGGDMAPNGRWASEGFAEFAGLLIGDGYIGDDGRIGIARHIAASYMDHYRGIIRAEFTNRGGVPRFIERERATMFYSMRAMRELRALGLGGTAKTKSIPEWVFRLSPKLRAAFVRGYVDADGSVSPRGKVTFASPNERLIRQLRELVMGLGVPVANVSASRVQATLPNGRIHVGDVYRFICSDGTINREVIGTNDAFDAERLANAPPSARKYRYRDRMGKFLQAPAGLGYAKITRITPSPVEVPVYDLTVEESHNFVAEGIVVHNSMREFRKMLYVDTLGPWSARIEATVEAQLVRDFLQPDLFVEFNIQEKLQGDFEETADALRSHVQVPDMSVNGSRKIQNQEPFGDPNDPENPYNWPARPSNYIYGSPPDGADVELQVVPSDDAAAAEAELRLLGGNP